MAATYVVKTEAEKLEDLRALYAAGEFHHATHRHECGGMLAIYVREDNKFNGFKLSMCFGERTPEYELAYSIVRNSGVSVGSRGEG